MATAELLPPPTAGRLTVLRMLERRTRHSSGPVASIQVLKSLGNWTHATVDARLRQLEEEGLDVALCFHVGGLTLLKYRHFCSVRRG